MKEFSAMPKKWGNSLGIVIPKEIVDEAKLSTKKEVKILLTEEPKVTWRQLFGTGKRTSKKTTQELLEEMDAEEREAEERALHGHVSRR